ncbi:MAG: hypothetical protein SZ59_C0002G0045 [candidate division TM6 bacterium GW2011_GWF2_28_16]|nr:MAG: hypothetical protein SZ59_C0002G0045 [candidate division TM6 bacterium GW2011_GWF2_28_16]
MYILEGNIGAGKSTFLSELAHSIKELEILTEPVNNWANQIFGQSLLENFYKDTSRWAFTLENLAMIHRVKDHIEIQNRNNQNILIERSIYSGHYCFSLNSFKNGHLTQIEWEIYSTWANYLLKNCNPPVGFIYLKADPEVCMQRIKKRNRISEKKITLGYIRQIDEWHEKFLIHKENIAQNLKNIPVLTLDCNQDFVENKNLLQEHINKVKDFISKTQAIPKFVEKVANFEQNL